MVRIYELYDKVPQAVLCLKEDDGSLTKVCDVKDISHVNPTFMPDIDAIKDINPITPRLISDNDDSIDVDYADFIFKTQETYSIKCQLDDINKSFADWLSKTVYSYKVICTTMQFQKRCHHKYRTNKKWAKRYGYYYVEVQDEPIIFMNGTIYCTKDGFDQIKKICGGKVK